MPTGGRARIAAPRQAGRARECTPLPSRQKTGARQAASVQKVRKTAHELDAIVRAEAVRVIGPWPVGLRMLIFPLTRKSMSMDADFGTTNRPAQARGSYSNRKRKHVPGQGAR
jgi:hypothetical protein